MPKMTLSRLLRLVAAKKHDMATWGARIAVSNVVLDGKKQSYTFQECSDVLAKTRSELVRAKALLQKANVENMIQYHEVGTSEDAVSETKSISMAEAILLLAEIKAEIALLQGLKVLDSKSESTSSYEGYGADRKEVKMNFLCSLTARERDTKVEFLNEKFAAINAALEAKNQTVIVEF
jgi:hypothetical protein